MTDSARSAQNTSEEEELDPRIKSRIFYADYCQVHVLKVTAYRGKKKAARKK